MMFQQFGQRFLAYLTSHPPGISDEEARMHSVARAGYPIGLVTHVGLLCLFFWLEVYPLAWFNVFSTILWGVSVWGVLKWGEVRWTFVACCLVEVPLHGILATHYLGLETGFILYIVASVVMMALNLFFSRISRVAICLLLVATTAGAGVWVIVNGAAMPVPQGWNIFFFAMNAVVLSGMMGGFMLLYEWVAATAEANLVESRFRTEAANKSLENVSRQLAKYISPQLYQAILDGEQEVRVESKRKKLTVFFSDIVGFTETTDQLQSEELTALLNEYLTEMSVIAQAHGANFDKFIGDAIVLYFGDPETLGVREDALQCVQMAIAMQRRMAELQAKWRDAGLERPFQLRIGINTGYCTVGNFGSEDRMDYTIIGGEVNLAARLEQASGKGGILLSNETFQLVKTEVMAEEADRISVKGFAKPITTYRVRGIYDDLAAQGRIIHHADGPVSVTIDGEQLDEAARKKAVSVLRRALDDLQKS